MQAHPNKAAAAREFPDSHNQKQLQEFLGFVNFIARHAGPNFHTAMTALRPYLKPGATFPMSEAANKACEALKR